MNNEIGHFAVTNRACTEPSVRSETGLFTALLLAALMLAGCDKPPPEEKLGAAGRALGDAASELTDLNTRIEQTEIMLDELRAERRKQRDKVRTLEERLEARATDVAIFRAVQSTLLRDEQLQEVAVAVDVEDRVVALSGVVRTEEEARRAVELSQQVAGVASVDSRIRVNDPGAGGTDDT